MTELAKLNALKVKIPFRAMIITAYGIMIIPIIIFFVGWLKWYWAVIFSAALLFGAFWLIKKDYWPNRDVLELPFVPVIIIGVALAFWAVYAGNCGVYVSNYDTPWRTALLRDLVNYDWPVYYADTDCALVYYLTFWMIPALAGKIFGLTGAFVVQWLWLTLIAFMSFLLLTYLLKDYSTRALVLIAVFLVMWSGMNVLGTLITETLGLNKYGLQLSTTEAYCDMFFNGESFNFLYRCNDEYMRQIYNQTPIIVAVPLLILNRNIHTYAFLGLILFPFSPWGTIGLAIFMIIDAVKYIKENKFKGFLKEAFSIPNLCAIFSIMLGFGTYFLSSSRTSSSENGGFGILTLSKFDKYRIFALLLFWLCEFGIYYALIWKKHHESFTFRCLLPVLMLIPFFWVGSIWGRDFCMNVSLPALFILMYYMIIYVKDEVIGKRLTARNFALLICLFIAAGTPIMNFAYSAKTMYAQHSLIVQDDSVYSYSDKRPEDGYYNFLIEEPKEKPFYKYFAKSIDD